MRRNRKNTSVRDKGDKGTFRLAKGDKGTFRLAYDLYPICWTQRKVCII
ncbi:hypothetical protein SAMN02745912_01969 [Paramaledivibacter caminithermalis DSM 15212]|jgi:hypothetical protein|uniref:Uncharacterized protein n=1 Tax=Paramaledivibacter caminithermalis (strain DSM 15212 / CIP 107654 / DViRD3) TaxID=1121301 RepID=A0A1M6P1W6_PARC5|nr:hypothetical protein SAMN02745912_01969 [Paramaledivibacter caminithermalis DSM 15212]